MSVVWQGLVQGSLYALVAIGYNIVLLSAGMVNFAYAAFVLLGTYLAYLTTVEIGLPWFVGVAAGAVVLALLSVVMERTTLRSLIKQHRHLTALIVTIGVTQIIDGIVKIIWGDQPKQVSPPFNNASMNVLGGYLRPNDVVIVVLVIGVALIFHYAQRHTLLGLSTLAVSEDPEAASLRGVNSRGLVVTAFGLAGALAGGLGLFVAGNTYADHGLAHSLAVLGIVAVVLGGAGNQLGALLGGLLAGLLGAFSGRYLGSEWTLISVFVLLLAILLVRPQGLFGLRTTRTV